MRLGHDLVQLVVPNEWSLQTEPEPTDPQDMLTLVIVSVLTSFASVITMSVYAIVTDVNLNDELQPFLWPPI